MWGTDYPHPEGTWPNTVARLRGDFGDVPVDDTRQMLGETAARCYGFDLDALRPIAEKIGPTPDDLGQDPSLVTHRRGASRRGEWWKDEYGIAERLDLRSNPVYGARCRMPGGSDRRP